MAHHKTVWRNNEKDRVRSCIRFIVGRFGVCSGKNVPGDVRRWSLSCFDIIISKNVFGGKANGIRAKTGVTDCQKGGKSRQGVFFKGDTHLSCPISHVRPVLELARRLAVFLLETLGKILRVVEAYGIGHFGHGHVGLP